MSSIAFSRREKVLGERQVDPGKFIDCTVAVLRCRFVHTVVH
jgi:hypothetical protein